MTKQAQILDLYDEGLSIERISQLMKIDESKVREFFKELN